MFKINKIAIFAQEIRKSRFRAVAAWVQDEEAAKVFLKSHSDPDANHNCWAWRIGQSYRFSDDGEPSGTAGKPILQAINGQSIDCVAVIVTRWFGGILLGSSGLVRAYGGTAGACIKVAEKSPLIARTPVTISCVFGDLSVIEARLTAIPEARVHSRQFKADGAELHAELPEQEVAAITQMIIDITSGRATVTAH